MSLIELLISLSILATVATVLSTLLISTLQSQDFSARQDEMVQTARLAMERMVTHVRQANRVLLPLDNNPTRDVLALGGFIDNDGDGRYDEDPPADLTADGAAGIVGIDDDGDGSIDEGSTADDDEDGANNEDQEDASDNDGDGAIDEDAGTDLDGQGGADDDSDGASDEDPVEPIVYYLDTTTRTLWERYPMDATATVTTALAERVDTFQVQRLTGVNGVVLIDILLRLRDQSGVVEIQTRAFPRNQ